MKKGFIILLCLLIAACSSTEERKIRNDLKDKTTYVVPRKSTAEEVLERIELENKKKYFPEEYLIDKNLPHEPKATSYPNIGPTLQRLVKETIPQNPKIVPLDAVLADGTPDPNAGFVDPEERYVMPSKFKNSRIWGPITWTDTWKDFDFTGVGWSFDGVRHGGILVGPRHMLMARHYGISTAKDADGNPTRRVVFHDKAGQPVVRWAVAKKYVTISRYNSNTGTTDPVNTDIACVLLNDDVPDSIAIYPVLQSDGYLLNNGLVIMTNQYKEVWPKYINNKFGINEFSKDPQAFGTMISWKAAFQYDSNNNILKDSDGRYLYDEQIRPWEKSLINMDSGHPTLAVVGKTLTGKPILSAIETHTTPSSGPCYWSNEVLKNVVQEFKNLEINNPPFMYP